MKAARLRPVARSPGVVTALAMAALIVGGLAVPAVACPFCGAVGESLSQRRDRSTCVAVGEAEDKAGRDAVGLVRQGFILHQFLEQGGPRNAAGPVGGEACGRAGDIVTARVAAPVAGTAILFASRGAGVALLEWSAIAADEAVIGHVVAAPSTRAPAAERLAWFAGRLEHPEPRIAEDAFVEFGLAPFEAVRSVAGSLDAEKLRRWVGEPGIDPRRRGFYGLALGVVTAAATDAAVRAAGLAALRTEIEKPANDFRAGFDGLLAGLLVAEGDDGLTFIEQRGLLAPTARPGDQRHLLAALRFARESLPDTISPRQIAAATAKLLASPVVAAEATIDLARYRAWDAVDAVAALWDTAGQDDSLVQRAVAGYLTACPLPAARAHLAGIRQRDPRRLDAAIDAARLPSAR